MPNKIHAKYTFRGSKMPPKSLRRIIIRNEAKTIGTSQWSLCSVPNNVSDISNGSQAGPWQEAPPGSMRTCRTIKHKNSGEEVKLVT